MTPVGIVVTTRGRERVKGGLCNQTALVFVSFCHNRIQPDMQYRMSDIKQSMYMYIPQNTHLFQIHKTVYPFKPVIRPTLYYSFVPFRVASDWSS